MILATGDLRRLCGRVFCAGSRGTAGPRVVRSRDSQDAGRSIRLSAGGHSERGRRPVNQDRLYCNLRLGLFLVADGMGGRNSGEVAAHLAVETVARFIEASQSQEVTWPYGLDPGRSREANRLATAIRLANRRVHREALAHSSLSGMGTTLVAMLVAENRAVLGSVGDSRIYRVHGDTLQLLTRDDTWLTAMAPDGAVKEAAIQTNPMRHVLTSAIGVDDDLVPALREEPVTSGEHWLLCSDGVHGHAEPASVADTIRAAGSIGMAAVRIVKNALAAGARDDATALVVRVE